MSALKSAPAPSPHQKAIYSFLSSSQENFAVDAVAGSGKTTTLLACVKLLAQTTQKVRFDFPRIVVLAFNKSTATELQQRLPSHLVGHVLCTTTHSYGLSLLKAIAPRSVWCPGSPEAATKARLEERATNLMIDPSRAHVPRFVFANQAAYALSKVKTGAWSFNEIETDSTGSPIYPESLVLAEEEYESQADLINHAVKGKGSSLPIDFDDMVWLPTMLHEDYWHNATEEGRWLAPEYVLIDEAQDLNPTQFALLHTIHDQRGQDQNPIRYGFFGDPNQAIYAWRGSDAHAWSRIQNEFKTAELPLSVSWRCPTRVIDRARQIVPRIEPSPSAQEGEIFYSDYDEMMELAAPDDIIVCRTNAPLVRLAINDLLSGRLSRVLGRDVKASIMTLARKLKATSLLEKRAKVQEHYDRLRLRKRTQIQQDITLCLMELLKGVSSRVSEGKYNDPKTSDEINEALTRFLEELSFAGDEDDKIGRPFSGLTYQSIHKAKGKEADVVWIYGPELMPGPWAQTPEEKQEERNIEYVAVTRSRNHLHFVPQKVVTQ